MYCKKCKFHASDSLSTCPKCGANWEETRKALFLNWLTGSRHWEPSAPETPKPQNAAERSPVGQSAAAAMDDLDDFSDDFLQPPQAPPSSPVQKPAHDGTVAVPEIDFSLGAPQAGATPVSPPPVTPPDEDVMELDFSDLVSDSPQPPAAAKQEDLSIPDLEAMLSQVENHKNPQPAPENEDDIQLDFSNLPSPDSPEK
ncbi:hypothetical protein AXF15_05760 [Desulfomicrobium orale DSM 12838]|uniref:Uncharacterized protein n=1 Tax=Desulfomicrobium orale DSM 12838 TaxID=888061 RepID=A0A0X8JPN6_9BACT|nr:hypothetical protein AXF15_05760 [Desulfomicrobium orale DSM 12838]